MYYYCIILCFSFLPTIKPFSFALPFYRIKQNENIYFLELSSFMHPSDTKNQNQTKPKQNKTTKQTLKHSETPGEDPFYSGIYAATYVSAMQEGYDPRCLKVVATCKHFDAYSLELWDGIDRHHFNAIVDDKDLVETYFPAFESCVTKGKVKSIMCSYNEVNGIPRFATLFLAFFLFFSFSLLNFFSFLLFLASILYSPPFPFL